jgi:arginine/lysine/ornithine decarboxylase
MPIGEAIEDFHRRGDLSLGIPAHRSGTGRHMPGASRSAGDQAFGADIGMNNGVDNRHQSWQVEPTAMQLFADAVGARRDTLLDQWQHRERARRDDDGRPSGRDPGDGTASTPEPT